MKDILIYQDLDLKIKKIENDILESDSRKNATEMQNHLRALQEKLAKLEQQAQNLNQKYEKVEAGMAEASKKFEQLTAKANIVVGADAEALAETAKTMQNILQTYDREASSLGRIAEEISRELESVMKNAKTAKKNLLFYREQYDKLRASKETELQELKKQLKAKEATVDKKLLSKYLSKQTGRNTRIFVPLENGRCGGCKMEIAQSGLAKIAKDKFMECENCGRIIYID